MIESFGFLRPGWLLALPAGLALLWLWWRARAGLGLWRGQVDPELLAVLAERAPASSARLMLGLAGTALALACVALAGPTWRAQEVPLYRDHSARIVVFDLSRSMDAIDVVPSRLERARAAIATILRESADAQLGVVVFGADAFTVAPLMNDPSALVHLLGSLGTATPPRAGARPDLALAMAQTLLEQSGVVAGDVILVGDSIGDGRTMEAARALASAGFPLSVLAVGTEHGGPVRLASGAFARDADGEVLVPRTELFALEQIARAGGGSFHRLANEQTPRFARAAQTWAAAPAAPARVSAVRQDDGAWFVLLLLPFAAALFRRGWLTGVAVFALALPAPEAEAFDWADLWRRADQQAADAFATGQFGQHGHLVPKLGAGSPWHATLLYRSGRFAEAADAFALQDTADAHYNRGNALALDGRLEAALAAYGAALERSPTMRDALFNRAMVREALAKRRAQAERSGETRLEERPRARLPSDAEAQASGARRGARPERGQRDKSPGRETQSRDAGTPVDRAMSAVPSESTARRPEAGEDGAELRRLEGLLATVPDDPGSLLANRFAWQLKLRGRWHHDVGERW